jgi:stage V sporulation protein R
MSETAYTRRKRRIAADLREPVREAAALAGKLGLTPYPVDYWVVDHDEMNRLIAYGGFQTRYPHWRWGMQYDRQRKQDQFGAGKAFEIVNNDDPSNAFLQASNSLADQKAVITHVEAHADFFANNEWFGLFARDGTAAEREAESGAGPSVAPAQDRPDPDAESERTPGKRGLNAAAILERHADLVAGYMENPDIDREAIESFIDDVLTLTDTIDQHRPRSRARGGGEAAEPAPDSDSDPDPAADLGLSDPVRQQVFGDEPGDAEEARVPEGPTPDDPARDVLAYLCDHGEVYDESEGRAVEMTDWQREVLEALRTEAYYFAPQRMTKVMNEGWAAYWESLMMGEECFAGDDEFLTYADHQARVLGSPGLNPYRLGKQLWEYVENRANRREVIDRLLRVEGVSPQRFHERIDFAAARAALEPDPAIAGAGPNALEDLAAMAAEGDPRVDGEAVEAARADETEIDLECYPWKALTYEGLVERHYSLVKPQYRGFLDQVNREDLERIDRYVLDRDRYATVEEALEDVDREAGWARMREVRESYNDVTFLDEFLTGEFVSANGYFTYEFSEAQEDFRVASTEAEAVKRKLLLQFTNFGKPTVVVYDGNFRNRGELLLAHEYNGVVLDREQAMQVLERIYRLWGRPVNLATIVKEYDDREVERARRAGREPEPVEVGRRVRYNGEDFETHDLDSDLEERIAAADIDYDTKPEDWL